MPTLHLALVHPEIPQNTGNIGRLCLALDARLHLVHPLGFSTDEKAVRRAGLDYWKHVDVQEHPHLDAFSSWAAGRRVFSLSSDSSLPPYTAIRFQAEDVLVFGCESVGLPWSWVERFGGWRIPMIGGTRSLNLANAASVVAYEALQQVRPDLFVVDSPAR